MVRVLEAYGRVPSDVEGKNEVVSNLRKFFKELSLEFREILAREGKLFDDYEIARKTIYKGIRYEDIDTLVRAYSECNKRNYRNLTKEQMD